MRDEAKARQAAIQKKMQESRDQFALANKKDLQTDNASNDTSNNSNNNNHDVDRQCVLCHECSSSDQNPLCSLVLLQPFSVVEECSLINDAKEAGFFVLWRYLISICFLSSFSAKQKQIRCETAEISCESTRSFASHAPR
jgi:hypothetical protein